jgi:hypothetical protein
VKVAVIFGYAIVLYLLVRPAGNGPQLVTLVGTALSSVLNAATGGVVETAKTKIGAATGKATVQAV